MYYIGYLSYIASIYRHDGYRYICVTIFHNKRNVPYPLMFFLPIWGLISFICPSIIVSPSGKKKRGLPCFPCYYSNAKTLPAGSRSRYDATFLLVHHPTPNQISSTCLECSADKDEYSGIFRGILEAYLHLSDPPRAAVCWKNPRRAEQAVPQF